MKTEFRAKAVLDKRWVYGNLYQTDDSVYILNGKSDMEFSFYQVDPYTVGQLRYEKDGMKYFDGDVYYNFRTDRNEVVDELGELQVSILSGKTDDIGLISGNIHNDREAFMFHFK